MDSKFYEVLMKQGVFAVALGSVLMIVMSMHDTQTKEYQMRLDQATQERKELVSVIRDNTSANEKLADAVDKMLQRLK